MSRTGHDIFWRVSWVDPDTAAERVEVLELVEAGTLVGSLMGRGVGVIGVHDNALWLQFELDKAERGLAPATKSP